MCRNRVAVRRWRAPLPVRIVLSDVKHVPWLAISAPIAPYLRQRARIAIDDRQYRRSN